MAQLVKLHVISDSTPSNLGSYISRRLSIFGEVRVKLDALGVLKPSFASD
jgi:hypothetical protein